MRARTCARLTLADPLFLAQNAEAYEGPVKQGTKADVTINTSDDTFVDMADGKLNGQKAFMSGKLKVKGNIMLATSECDRSSKIEKPMCC